jgi:diaminopimelate decarboxylase
MMPDEAYSAFAQNKDSEHLNLNGIHLHIGSQNPETNVYAQAFSEMFACLLHIHRETGIRLQHINLGGGFPVNYLRDRSLASEFPAEQRDMFSADFEPADAIREAWAAVSNQAKTENALDLLNGITLLLEPGRSIISDAAICLTTVRNHKERPALLQGSPPYEGGVAAASADGVVLSTDHRPLTTDHWLLTDAGFNILLSMETYKWYYHLISAERADQPHKTPYKLAGPLCDGGDVYFDIEAQNRLPDHRPLPENVEPGEILALLNCGAYSLAQASQYNGRFLPPVVLIKENSEAELIRRREAFEDLITSDVL